MLFGLPRLSHSTARVTGYCRAALMTRDLCIHSSVRHGTLRTTRLQMPTGACYCYSRHRRTITVFVTY